MKKNDIKKTSLINRCLIDSLISNEHGNKFLKGHGVSEDGFLGFGLLYFALAYTLRASTCVCLGSGSGMVPRLMRQAQRDSLEHTNSTTILIDGNMPEAGFGQPGFLDNESDFRTSFSDIEIIINNTYNAAELLEHRNIKIDYLHIDADHTYEGIMFDFERYLPMMNEGFVITIHDTRPTERYPNIRVHEALQDIIDRHSELEFINFNHLWAGLAIVKPKKVDLTKFPYLTKDYKENINTPIFNAFKNITINNQKLNLSFQKSVHNIDAKEWDACNTEKHPFMDYKWISAMEKSGIAAPKNGLIPIYATLRHEDNKLFAVIPLFIKNNFRCEANNNRMFASVANKKSYKYHPIVQATSPMTPVPGPRILASRSATSSKQEILTTIVNELLKSEHEVIEFHLLHDSELCYFKGRANILLSEKRYSWENHNYASFNDYLMSLKKKTRSNIRVQLRKIQKMGISIHHLRGKDITPHVWSQFFEFYVNTFERHNTKPCLNEEFYYNLDHAFREKIILTMAQQGDVFVGGGLSVVGPNELYFRSWGRKKNIDFLLFALTYNVIELAISNNYKYIDFGIGNKAKSIKRLLTPYPIHSAYWLRNKKLLSAISKTRF